MKESFEESRPDEHEYTTYLHNTIPLLVVAQPSSETVSQVKNTQDQVLVTPRIEQLVQQRGQQERCIVSRDTWCSCMVIYSGNVYMNIGISEDEWNVNARKRGHNSCGGKKYEFALQGAKDSKFFQARIGAQIGATIWRRYRMYGSVSKVSGVSLLY